MKINLQIQCYAIENCNDIAHISRKDNPKIYKAHIHTRTHTHTCTHTHTHTQSHAHKSKEGQINKQKTVKHPKQS